MSKWPMRGHFRYLRFKTFPMTSRKPQCEVFCPFLSNSEHSGVPEDSNSQLFQVLGFTPTLGQSGVATTIVINNKNLVAKTKQLQVVVNVMVTYWPFPSSDKILNAGQNLCHLKTINHNQLDPIGIKGFNCYTIFGNEY